ncbi:hypothetical protein G4Z16_01805 [Streptomyces bathyalis]|uniref:DUF1328 domain-containing protein n=1 Tax=Streptomyces bathyalis TaxID=2710756 RepID=A0A7T1T2Q8_9ACTN|nr:DUF6153 family protein [Streptomyces bathyalis]QPP05330.1 hypothetical protein G4Z16_01805 [Streptomyces bathyalis]
MVSTRRALRPLGVRGVLLMLAVLTGLVAMHGLGPTPAPQHERAMPAMSSHGHLAGKAAPGHETAARAAESACHHMAYGASSGGHLNHADATCAASGISGSPTLTTPAPGQSVDAPFAAPRLRSDAATATERAPPSLSQLQLLRI